VRAPRRRPASRAHASSDQDRQRAIAELRERATTQARALVTGDDWAAWLRLAARLPGWSFTNILLIAEQRPAATMVAGYQAWQAQGRHVRTGEPGIQVIAEPRLSPGRPGAPSLAADVIAPDGAGNRAGEARLAYVWDITQTSGPARADREMPLPPEGGAPAGLWDALTWLARREGFAVDRARCSPGDSLTNWSTRRIRIQSDLSRTEAAQALIHELGHVLAHGSLAHLPAASTAGCRGVRKIEADSIAFVVATRLGMDTSTCSWPYVASWAGSDPRARPEEAIRATGARITAAATVIAAHLDVTLFATTPQQAAPVPDLAPEPARNAEAAGGHSPAAHVPADTTGMHAKTTGPAAPDQPALDVSRILLDAERFYLSQLNDSWVPGYLTARGLNPATMTRWRIGYAPAGWTVLTSHLRALGHHDAGIEAAGLARLSSRGTFIDHFRDRVMLAIRDEHGTIAGFIGRAHPNARPTVPKYLNSPETALYTKGDLLFGLHEARDPLARGAVPVIVEGPFDAIAISAADPGRYAGLAPCGTALTSQQAAALGRVTDLRQTGVLVALDGDRAGREAAIKAYSILLAVTSKTTAITLPTGRDPAEILQADGPAALRDALQHQTEPLARVVIDAHLGSWARHLDHPEGQLNAMRSAASLIARLLPPGTADRIVQITSGRQLATLDDELHPVANPELELIARMLPANATCQVVQVADRLESDYSEVTAEVANALSRKTAIPKRTAARGHRNDPGLTHVVRADPNPARLATAGFPDPHNAAVSTGATTAAAPYVPPMYPQNATRCPAHR
jgi:DNA primase